MKRLIITIIIALAACATANAQYANSTKYKDLKKIYNHKEYVRQSTDPYNVDWFECASFFVPGVGQLLSGEVWRGIGFIAGEAFLVNIMQDTATTIDELAIKDEKGAITGFTDKKKANANLAVFFGSLAVDLGLCIWSCIDARNIARVKDMYYQDLIGREKPIELGFAPSVSIVPSPSGSIQPSAGLALQIAF